MQEYATQHRSQSSEPSCSEGWFHVLKDTRKGLILLAFIASLIFPALSTASNIPDGPEIHAAASDSANTTPFSADVPDAEPEYLPAEPSLPNPVVLRKWVVAKTPRILAVDTGIPVFHSLERPPQHR